MLADSVQRHHTRRLDADCLVQAIIRRTHEVTKLQHKFLQTLHQHNSGYLSLERPGAVQKRDEKSDNLPERAKLAPGAVQENAVGFESCELALTACDIQLRVIFIAGAGLYILKRKQIQKHLKVRKFESGETRCPEDPKVPSEEFFTKVELGVEQLLIKKRITGQRRHIRKPH